MNTSPERSPGALALRLLAALQALAIVGIVIDLLTRETPRHAERSLASWQAEEDPSQRASSSFDAPPGSPARGASADAPPLQVPNVRAESAAFTPPAGSIVLAVVRDDRGQVPERARVGLRLGDGADHLAHKSLDERGVVSFAGLAPGSYELVATCDGHREARVSFVCAEGLPPQRFELLLVSAWILGVRFETKEGRAHHELWKEWRERDPRLGEVLLTAIATRWEPLGDFPLTSLRHSFYGLGLWRNFFTMARPERIPEGCVGYLELEAREPLWVSAALRHRVVAKQRVEPGQSIVVFAIDESELFAELATVRMRVVDAVSGRPVPGARVELDDQQSSGLGMETDAEGRAELRHLRPGLLVLSVTKDGASCDRLQVRLEGGESLELGDLAIRSTREVRVRCEGLPNGATDFYLWAIALDPPSHPSLKQISHEAITVADGGFYFSLPEGRYALRATGAGGAYLEIDTRALGAEPVVLRLAPEAAFRFDARAKGEAIEMAIVDGNSRRIARHVLSFDRRFEIRSLPGPHRIELTGRDGVTVVREVVLPPEGLDVRVP
jgi:hypothetical protein